nr:hypothetical protein [Mucilaginibacter oryzae]
MGFPVKGLPNQLAFLIDEDLLFAVRPHRIITHRRMCRPITTQQHLFHTGDTFLLAKLIVELAKKEQHFLLQLPGRIGRINRLGD